MLKHYLVAAWANCRRSPDPIPLTPWPFAAGLAVSLAIAWLAVGGQTWRAASSAPIQAIRQS
jgi:hypothetical protein